MDIEAVRARAGFLAGVAFVLIAVGLFALYASSSSTRPMFSGAPNTSPSLLGWLALRLGWMLGMASAVGWVVTARSRHTH